MISYVTDNLSMMAELLPGVTLQYRWMMCYLFQLIGLFLVLAAGICQKKNWILFLTFCANMCSVLVMLTAGRYDGAAATCVCTLRSFLYLFQDRVHDNKIFWGCVAAQIIVGVMAWQSLFSLLVIAAPVVLCIVSWFGSVRQIKWGTIFSDLCWAVFDMSSGIYIEGARDIAETLANIAGLWRTEKMSDRTPNETS